MGRGCGYVRFGRTEVNLESIGFNNARLDVVGGVVRGFESSMENTSEEGSADAAGEVKEYTKTVAKRIDCID